MKRLLIIDDDRSLVEELTGHIDKNVLPVTITSGATVLDVILAGEFSAVFIGDHLQKLDRLDLLRAIHREVDAHLPVMLLVDPTDVESAVRAMRLGAFNCIPNNTSIPALAERICEALQHYDLNAGVKALHSSLVHEPFRMVFASEIMKKLNYEITRLARFDFDILLEGETGVGKDLIAFELHDRSERKDKPFVSVAVKSLTETLIESELFGHEKGAFSGADKTKIGKLEAAHGGTVYIPEVSRLTEPLQLKLFQFMQYKTISRVGQDARKPETKLDVRIIMATNDALEIQVANRGMCEEFYHRITGVKLTVPPLRERLDDVEPLAKYFLDKYSRGVADARFEFGCGVLTAFRKYHWPGNVRELENWVKSAIAHSTNNVLSIQDFPQVADSESSRVHDESELVMHVDSLLNYKAAETEFKRAYFREVLKRADNNVTKAAGAAGITRQGLRKILNTLVRSNHTTF
jgi:DNA-binding NtrC family response regulator